MDLLHGTLAYRPLIGALLSIRREVLGLSQAACARQCGMTQGPFGRIELGKASCSMEHLFNIAGALRATASEIAFEADAHVAAADSCSIPATAEDPTGGLGLGRSTLIAAAAAGNIFWGYAASMRDQARESAERDKGPSRELILKYGMDWNDALRHAAWAVVDGRCKERLGDVVNACISERRADHTDADWAHRIASEALKPFVDKALLKMTLEIQLMSWIASVGPKERREKE